MKYKIGDIIETKSKDGKYHLIQEVVGTGIELYQLHTIHVFKDIHNVAIFYNWSIRNIDRISKLASKTCQLLYGGYSE